MQWGLMKDGGDACDVLQPLGSNIQCLKMRPRTVQMKRIMNESKHCAGGVGHLWPRAMRQEFLGSARQSTIDRVLHHSPNQARILCARFHARSCALFEYCDPRMCCEVPRHT